MDYGLIYGGAWDVSLYGQGETKLATCLSDRRLWISCTRELSSVTHCFHLSVYMLNIPCLFPAQLLPKLVDSTLNGMGN